MSNTIQISEPVWRSAGEKRYGADMMAWRFRCPSCGHIASAADWKNAGAPQNAVAFSCVGRWIEDSKGEIFEKGKGPCNYAGGGLFRLNPVTVQSDDREHEMFDFADSPLVNQDDLKPCEGASS